MKYYKIIFIIGIWVLLIPFFAIPVLLKQIFMVIPGILLMIFGVLMSHLDHLEDNHDGLSYEESIPEPVDATYQAPSFVETEMPADDDDDADGTPARRLKGFFDEDDVDPALDTSSHTSL
ncbi:MAG: hypothetical protein LRY41_02820 [Candidatus Pacebacteria bacterium]|nr:hypothetical protein [Candidatus Paceibacterota bacterium]MCD8508275.1 hypothetical protein [Candidatus Paceibacterota bacterium]MCD8528230.1 hypothetical protein [Candidatus Paceibacterota bacterium]MCD8564001.1 hypothetical protein [Candidatus Paceibacterota bacterium]